jgi:hypothetical protein
MVHNENWQQGEFGYGVGVGVGVGVLTVSFAFLLVTLPAELLTTTEKRLPLSAAMVGGVV